MAISDGSITSVELVNTFEQWRSKTNQLITVLNENSDEDPTSNLISANSLGGLLINTISANIVTGSNVTGSRLIFSGGTVDFTGATVTDLGTTEKFALVEDSGATISGASPDSKIERAQINQCEINLNGETLRANGASTIILTGAIISDLGTVDLVTIDGGTINDVNVNLTDSGKIVKIESPGPHLFTGATFANGTYSNAYSIGGFMHSANISVNSSSVLVSNVGALFGTDVGASNVAIGNFPEYSTTPTNPTSSKGRLHVRTDFADAAQAATTVETVADEVVLEGNTTVGMTLLSNNAANCIISFGDPDDTDVGGVLYNHVTDSLHVVTDGANTAEFGNEYGGYMQIAGGDTLGSQAGKLHVNVGSSDGIAGVYLDLNDVDQVGVSIDADQTTANVFEINADAYQTGHVISLHNGLGTGTSYAANGSLIKLTDNNSSTNARAILDIVQDATGATGTMGLRVTTDAGIGINVVQNADKPGINVWSDTAHTEPLGEFHSTSTTATGASLLVKGLSSTATTKILTVANSSADMFAVTANGAIWTGTHGGFLTTQHPTTAIYLLGVRDQAGDIINTN